MAMAADVTLSSHGVTEYITNVNIQTMQGGPRWERGSEWHFYANMDLDLNHAYQPSHAFLIPYVFTVKLLTV